jgi:transcriptional regulator with XRE-family HTH domain
MKRDEIKGEAELARLAGVPQSALHKFLHNKQDSLSFAILEKLAHYFVIDPARLFDTNAPFIDDKLLGKIMHVSVNLNNNEKMVLIGTGEALLKTHINPP